MQLKYFKEYKKALKKYAKSIGFKIIYRYQDTDGIVVPTRNYISIDKELSESDEIAALLHELGHTMDDSIKYLERFKHIEKAYGAVYRDKYSKTQLRLVLETEKRAWKYGEAIAKLLHIRLGKWYFRYRNLCLNSYRK